MTGKILNQRYEIKEKIGEGGMADIYLARDLRLKRKVALKVLHSQLASEPQILTRFIREAQSAARLIHPNIVNVYDIENTDECHYIVMEYIKASNLKDVIYQNAPLNRDTCFSYFRQIAGAVQYAHDNGIIHRDLKPQNVLVDDGGVVKVTDFGIARAITSSSLTQTGSMMGSVQYFSPEQAQGKPVDRTTDIYSLGIILFECLTGRLPFEADNLVAVAFKQVQEEPPAPSSINRNLDPVIDRVILKALSKDPATRYQDVNSLVEDVKKALFSGSPAGSPRRDDMEKTLVSPGSPVIPAPALDEDIEDDDPDDDEIPSRRGGGGSYLYIVFLVLFLTVVTMVFIKRGFVVPSIGGNMVPDMEGMQIQRARELADEQGWLIQITDERFDDRYPEGIILEQDPPLGTQLDRGGTVRIVLSRGRPVVEIPQLVGMNLSRAAQELTGSGLKWEVRKQVYSDRYEKDAIVAQDPPPGEMASPGIKVMLDVSRGKEMTEVPDMVGKTWEEARKMAVARGFTLEVSDRRFNDRFLEGSVISHIPLSGAMTERGTRIKVILSRGPEEIIESLKTPKLTGKTIAQARQDYSSMGIEIVVDNGTHADDVEIVSQNPGEGTPLPQDGKIRVTLKQQAVVPNLLGRTLEDAQNVIYSNGLKMGTIEYQERPRIMENVVLDQSPKSGIEVEWGSKVNITISRKSREPEPAESPGQEP